jgi:glycosyltransferase involved in cell wall biosynthesis
MSPSFLDWARAFSARAPVAHDSVVPLSPPLESTSDEELSGAREWWNSKGVRDDDSLRVMFVGTFSPFNDFGTLARAAAICAERGVVCQFVVCGGGTAEEDVKRAFRGLGNVVLPGWVDRAKIRVLADRSTCAVVPVISTANYAASIPNKVLDFMQLGLPILTPLDGEVRRLVEENGVGLMYRAGDADSLVAAIARMTAAALRQEMSLKASALFARRYSFESVYGDLVSRLESMALCDGDSSLGVGGDASSIV